MDEMNLEAINLEAVDVDGAIREGAEEVAGDTRISFLRKGAIAGGAALSGGAILSALVPGVALASSGRPPASFGTGDIGILNFALTLEYLERAFYNEATNKGAITDPKTATFLKVTTHDERKHVAFLKKALGKHAVKEPKFNFHGTTANQATFQQTAYVLENTGVHAYLGQAGNIKDAKIPARGSVDRHHRSTPLRGDRIDHQQSDQPQRRVRQRPSGQRHPQGRDRHALHRLTAAQLHRAGGAPEPSTRALGRPRQPSESAPLHRGALPQPRASPNHSPACPEKHHGSETSAGAPTPASGPVLHIASRHRRKTDRTYRLGHRV